MKISATDVAYVAALANLEVPDGEKEALAAQLSRIVEYVELLNTLDTEFDRAHGPRWSPWQHIPNVQTALRLEPEATKPQKRPGCSRSPG